jgi:hypothetical protein
LKQPGKVLLFHDKDERDELATFLATNPGPWIATFLPPSAMNTALQGEIPLTLCTMKTTSYYDDGKNRYFVLRCGNRLFGFQEIKTIIGVAQIFGCVSRHNERY